MSHARSLQFLLFMSILPRCLSAQALAQRVGAVEEGTVRLSFAARAGICGDWANGISLRQDSEEFEEILR